MDKPFNPVFDRVLVKLFKNKEERTLPSGIIIPDSSEKEEYEAGEIVAIGAGKLVDGKFVPMQFKVGDKIVFSKFGHEKLKIGGEDHVLLLSEASVWGTLTE